MQGKVPITRKFQNYNTDLYSTLLKQIKMYLKPMMLESFFIIAKGLLPFLSFSLKTVALKVLNKKTRI